MKKFLVIRFSSIGDIVLTTPVVRCLKVQVPGCEVHFLSKEQYKEILDPNPYLDKRFYIQKNLSEIVTDLKKERYDYVIDLHHNLRTFFLKKALGVKSFSFPKINVEKWMRVNLGWNRLPTEHIVDRYFQTVKRFGVKNDGKGLDFYISQNLLRDNTENFPQTNEYVAFAIGGKFSTKKLPLEKLISICKKINGPIVLLGGKEDFEAAEKIVKEIGKTVFNCCGKYTLEESALAIRQSRLLITHDTGLMHIGAALKKEIVSIWGNTIPEFGMSPYYGDESIQNYQSEVKNLSCRPCSKIGFDACPNGHFKCMKDQDEGRIGTFVNTRK